MRSWKKRLLGVDLDDAGKPTIGSQRAVAQARWIARACGADVTLLHSTWTEDHVEARSQDAAREALEAVGRQVAPDARSIAIALAEERPWLAMTRAAIEGNQDLVIAAKRNDPDNDGRRLGLNARKLLRKCPAAVWLVHPEHEVLDEPVVAATDHSEVGQHAVTLAAEIADAAGVPLHLVHGYQIPMSLQMEHGRMSDADWDKELATLRDTLCERSRAGLSPDQSASCEVHAGRVAPERAILEVIQRTSADLLVMGTVSRSGVPGLLMGNTAERLIDLVDCSLLAVKPEDFISPLGLSDA
jgi:universal stress protein E